MQTKVGAGRPAGDVRRAVLGAYEALAERWGHATWRDAAVAAQLRADRANSVTKELVRAGQLEPVCPVAVPWSPRPMMGYRPTRAPQGQGVSCALQGVMRGWASA